MQHFAMQSRRPRPADAGGYRRLSGPALLFFMGAAPVSAIDLQQVVECSNPTPWVFCMMVEPAVSPNGQCIAFTDGTTWPPNWEWWPGIASMATPGGTCSSIHVGVSDNNWYQSPAWSPDGARLVFVAQGWDGPNAGLWTVAVGDDGAPPASRIHVVSGFASDPAWSLDGSSIAYTTSEGIWVVPSGGGVAQLLVTGGRSPSWGPDGQLVFERDGDLWIRRSSGSEHPIRQTPEHDTAPAWSPQGVWIAYASDKGGDYDIWVMAANGGTPVRVTSSPANEGHPSWSAAGDRLVYGSTLNDHDSIWLATNLPDWTIRVEPRSWSAVKQIYRESTP